MWKWCLCVSGVYMEAEFLWNYSLCGSGVSVEVEKVSTGPATDIK